jgi:hypothetical protein
VALTVGLFEITAAVSVLIRPIRSLIFIFLIWKMGTELFYPHFEFFEWIERGGSYGALLALWFVLDPTLKLNAKRLTHNAEHSARSASSGLSFNTGHIERATFSLLRSAFSVKR